MDGSPEATRSARCRLHAGNG